MSGKGSDPPTPRWLLHRADQATVAALVAAALVASLGWWIGQGGWRGRLIEVERAVPQTARFQVDINQADWPELANLPGVGARLAAPHRRLPPGERAVYRPRGPAATGPRHRSADAGIAAAVSAADAPRPGLGGEVTPRGRAGGWGLGTGDWGVE